MDAQEATFSTDHEKHLLIHEALNPLLSIIYSEEYKDTLVVLVQLSTQVQICIYVQRAAELSWL